MNNYNIHNTALLEGDIQLGNNVTIGAFTYIKGPVIIEDNVKIGVRCIIGTPAEHNKRPSHGSVKIGEGTQFTDGVIVHKGTNTIQTTIGKNCYIMNQCYIAHDCIIDDNVVLSAQVSLAGNVKLHKGANLGMGVQVHQFVTIGAYAMVGMACPVTCDIPPFVKAFGNPVRIHGINIYPLHYFNILPIDVVLKNGAVTFKGFNYDFDLLHTNFLATSQRAKAKMFTTK